ncbi:hypothetical protein Cgig2_029896 [Carnegiea gigantea]|uniref:3-ketoacyl-CoA synthase n=1 Tax=Carnegiea gigantea TaxID=171969 RepID=A0A9Q1QDE9_9CARY|nr:hypothetical protein Cgig2_029896 [Carnegiea gigantea]
MEFSSLVKFLLFANTNIVVNSSITLLLVILVVAFYLKYSNSRVIYLLDYACFKPPSTMRVPIASFVEHSKLVFVDNPKAARFQMRILERAGLGDETALPPAIHYIPPEPTMQRARDEAHLVIFSAVDELLKKTGLRPKDIGILVTNCSIFCPSPSLSSVIINKYKMRSAIKSFSLSGMGCSASPIAVDLASRLLKVQPNSCALVVSTEIITPNAYMGAERSMLVPACLFRLGCAAMLLTNKWAKRKQAKYRLLHTIRTHKGADDKAHKSEALKSNITTLGPLVLPISEKLLFVSNFLAQKILRPRNLRAYVPNFSKAFDHFCIHAGGRAVIDELQKGLRLSGQEVEASRMVLHRFGNTSSSSIWYELSYIEAKGRMKKGDHVWQIAFGSGFKCNSAVWKCNRNIEVESDGVGPWMGCIERYPAHIPHILKIEQ